MNSSNETEAINATTIVTDFETFYTPIYILTAVFGAIFIIGPLLVRKSENRGIIQTCIMLTAFCMWIFWVTIYISQMNPLVGPRVRNTTLIWIAYKWGKPAEGLNKSLREGFDYEYDS